LKTLIVKYIPRNERSVTHHLLLAFESVIRESEVMTLDLCKDQPQFFSEESIDAYYLRNLMGKELSPAQELSMSKMTAMTEQLKNADIVAVAFPMFNFSMPGAMKTWFDSVLQVGETIDPSGGVYRGLLVGKKALVLIASGGIYSSGNGIGPYFGQKWEHAMSLAKLELQFMGFSEVCGVMAEGTAVLDEDSKRAMISQKQNEIREIAQKWYVTN
jgi:FMN-dependent NADH-azoreductase